MAARNAFSSLLCQMRSLCVSKPSPIVSLSCSTPPLSLSSYRACSKSLSKPATHAEKWILRKGIKHHGTKHFNASVVQGIVGEGSAITFNTEEVDAMLPTAQTMRQLFDGVPYEDLPIVFIKATRNNTLINAVNIRGLKSTVIVYTSSRKEGFKNARKKTTIAGQATGVGAGQKLMRRGVTTVRAVVSGIGPGRMSSVSGIAAAGVKVVSISDRTFLPEFGPRPKKIRRV